MANQEESFTQTGKCPACRTENVPLKSVNGLFICEPCSSKRFSNKVRKSIQEAFEKQEEQRRREAWVRRLEIAKKGVKHFEDGKLPEALRTFKEYLGILETRYKVPPGYLQVGLFNKKEDAGEILLIAGIMWDMAKIHDQMKGQQAEVRRYLNKFAEFSVNKPHMIMASEAIRRYVANGSARNEKEFKDAHTFIQSHLTKCFIATAVYGETSLEVFYLRQFRDRVLEKTFLGRTFIQVYYFISPKIVSSILRSSRLRHLTTMCLNPVVRYLIKVPTRNGLK